MTGSIDKLIYGANKKCRSSDCIAQFFILIIDYLDMFTNHYIFSDGRRGAYLLLILRYNKIYLTKFILFLALQMENYLFLKV